MKTNTAWIDDDCWHMNMTYAAEWVIQIDKRISSGWTEEPKYMAAYYWSPPVERPSIPVEIVKKTTIKEMFGQP